MRRPAGIMSRPINEEAPREGRPISIADAPPGDATLAVTEIRATGRRGIPVLIAPLPQAAHAQQQEAAPFQGFLILEEEKADGDERRNKWFKEMRGWLMVLATVAASVTYQAGLNPPGGFWQDDSDGRAGGRPHVAGDPVLHDVHRSRYFIFYYFNATAFVTSLVIMVLLMSERFYHNQAKVVALMLTTFVDIISLIGAYTAGTTRFFSTCIYVIVIAGVSFAGVVYIGEVMAEICTFALSKMKCLLTLVQRKWFPVPAEVVRAAQQQREIEARKRQTRRTAATTTTTGGQRGGCSQCCGSAPRTDDV